MRISDWSSDVCSSDLLENHPAVACVYYPGLASHPDHAIAARQQRGYGAMLSFELAGGVEAVKRFVTEVRMFTLAESLGGVESLVAHPATMTHADMGEKARRTAGISDSLLRVSVGLEDEHDLLKGLRSEEHTSELQSLMRISYAVF